MTNDKLPRVMGTLNDTSFTDLQAAHIHAWLRKHGLINDKYKMDYDGSQITIINTMPIVRDSQGRVLYKPTKRILFGDFLDSLIRLDRRRWNAFKGAERQQAGLIKTLEKHLDSLRGKL